MENTINPSKLFAKIAAVMGTVRTLEKTGENKFDKYHYVTSDAIAARMGKVMAENGLAFLPSLISVETSEYATKSGGSNFRTVAHFQMTIACTETGATWTSQWSGEAIDRSDKSISKAAVSAVKYFLLKTFLLSGGDEEDADSNSPVIDGQRVNSAAPNRDDLWEPDAPVKPVASPAQVIRIIELGKLAYGAEWESNAQKLAQWASQGAREKPGSLLSPEADKLIKALEKKLAGERNGAAVGG